jgi:hypothetical protein
MAVAPARSSTSAFAVEVSAALSNRNEAVIEINLFEIRII